MLVHPNGVYERQGKVVLCVFDRHNAHLSGPHHDSFDLLFVRIDGPEDADCKVELVRGCRLDRVSANFHLDYEMKPLADDLREYFAKYPKPKFDEDQGAVIDRL